MELVNGIFHTTQLDSRLARSFRLVTLSATGKGTLRFMSNEMKSDAGIIPGGSFFPDLVGMT